VQLMPPAYVKPYVKRSGVKVLVALPLLMPDKGWRRRFRVLLQGESQTASHNGRTLPGPASHLEPQRPWRHCGDIIATRG